ncbi:MAG TPA: acetate--CoA ligase [Acidimicrobiales bacterium]|nr:acetate--CoA ligase [Acidimicrobiales bacterium]
MHWEVIDKRIFPPGRPPNMADYDAERRAFSWEAARAALDGLPGGRGLNIAYEAVDRHIRHGRGERRALICLGRGGSRTEVSYRQLHERSNRVANVLTSLGVGAGDTVAVLAPRTADLHPVVLGALKMKAVVSPLFAAFGPEPVRQRLELGRARVLVTTAALFRHKIAPLAGRLPHLEHILIVGGQAVGDGQGPLRTESLDRLMAAAGPEFEIPPTDPEDVALLHFTSGTTGSPKGALHVHGAVVAHHATGRLALDLHDDDVYWCTADPGWVTGTSYGIISPLACGLTSVVDEGEFEAERWYQVLEEHAVTVWYTSPTALRMLMKAGGDVARGHDLSALRFVASVGEPLNPEVVVWAADHLGLPIHDTWWQTETGGVMISNFACMDIRPGSMGRPLPGVEATVLRRDEDERIVVDPDGRAVEAGDDQEGELALRPGWPSMFRGYLDDEQRYRDCFVGGWYLTGDLAKRDRDGYFWFLGRGDDVIKSAGHLIGPFEVESILLEHPAVAEAGVVGAPDPIAGQVVKAFVALVPGYAPSEELRLDLVGFARRRLGATVAPRQIVFRQDLPHTESGKIVRRLLRSQPTPEPAG